MRAQWFCLLFAITVSSAVAQESSVWQTDLEAAKRLAQQSRRAVLVHFWAPWCAPCKQLESEVFTQAGFETAVNKCVEYIRAGDIFQVVISQRLEVPINRTRSKSIARCGL